MIAVLSELLGADVAVIAMAAGLAARGHLTITIRRRPEPKPRTETPKP